MAECKIPKWENAKSNRSRCRRCRIFIPKFSKRLKVNCKIGVEEHYIFYCESCASYFFGIAVQPELLESVMKEYSESVKKVIGLGQGRFYKYFRKIILGEE